MPNLIRVRPFNLIRYLSKQGHKITLMTLWYTEQDKQDLEELRPLCEKVVAYQLPRWRSLINSLFSLPTKQPIQSSYCLDPHLFDQVKRINDLPSDVSFDIVHVEHIRGVRYGLELLNGPLPVIWDSVDSISHLFEQSSRQSRNRLFRYLTRFELSRTRNYERQMLEKFQRILVTSRIDQNAFLNLHHDGQPEAEVSILPNGVDLEYFCPSKNITRDSDTIVLSGKMSYHANITMAIYLVNEIMPMIWQNRSNVKVWIVGKDPSKEVLALDKIPNITVTGTVSDIRPYLRKATIAVAPITYGSGIQNKVLEAMACGIPVISTPQAISALSVNTQREVVVADNSTDFAQEVLALIDDPERQMNIGNAGLDYVRKNHDWNEIVTRLVNIYKQEIAKLNR